MLAGLLALLAADLLGNEGDRREIASLLVTVSRCVALQCIASFVFRVIGRQNHTDD